MFFNTIETDRLIIREFDEYINSLISDLKINKKVKDEMAEEFREHLQKLKLEYVSKGISDSEAVKNAIESIGQGNILKRRIDDSVLNYRNNTTVFTGILSLSLVIIISIFGGPVPGVDASKVFSVLSACLLGSILLFIPLGYFIPVIFLKVKKARLVAIVTLPLGVLNGLYFSIALRDYLPISLIISIFLIRLFGGMLGSMLGYGILIIINKSSSIFTNSILKKR